MAPGVVGVGPELGEHHRHPEGVHDPLVEVAHGGAAVGVDPEHVEVRALGLDEVEVLEVAVGDGHRVVRVEVLGLLEDLAEERVEVLRPGALPLALGQVLDLEGAPGQPVVVLVAEHPHQQARGVPVALHHLRDLGLHRLAEGGVRVVDLGDPGAVQREPVAAHGVVEDRPDPVGLVDVRDPAAGHRGVEADGVDAHALHQGHLVGQRRLDHRVGLGPEAVVVVGADGEVVPVHPADEEGLAVDDELEAAGDVGHVDRRRGRGLRRRCRLRGRRGRRLGLRRRRRRAGGTGPEDGGGAAERGEGT